MAGAAYNARLVDALAKILSIKALAAEATVISRLDAALTTAAGHSQHAERLALVGRTIAALLDGCLVAFVIFLGAGLVLVNALTLGELVSFHLLSGHVTGPILGLAGLWDDWQNVLVARRRAGESRRQPAEPEAPPCSPWIAEGSGPGLRFEGIGFSYARGDPILNDFHAVIPAKGLTLVTGPSGCGKSTLGMLAARLLLPTKGRILHGDTPVETRAPGLHRQFVRYLPQSPELLHGTLRENLTLSGDRDDEEICASLAAVGLFGLVHRLDDACGDGGLQFSGGETQRICLARAFLRPPAHFEFPDEPTSSLDEEASRLVRSEIVRLADRRGHDRDHDQPELFSSSAGQIRRGRSLAIASRAAPCRLTSLSFRRHRSTERGRIVRARRRVSRRRPPHQDRDRRPRHRPRRADDLGPPRSCARRGPRGRSPRRAGIQRHEGAYLSSSA